MALGYVGLDLMLMDNNINRLDRRVERQLLRMAENSFARMKNLSSYIV